jgi:lysyl-tRNA synthetase class II
VGTPGRRGAGRNSSTQSLATSSNRTLEPTFRYDYPVERSPFARASDGDPDYVEAFSYGMQPAGGIGLGIDRFGMVLAGHHKIRDVIVCSTLRERTWRPI